MRKKNIFHTKTAQIELLTGSTVQLLIALLCISALLFLSIKIYLTFQKDKNYTVVASYDDFVNHEMKLVKEKGTITSFLVLSNQQDSNYQFMFGPPSFFSDQGRIPQGCDLGSKDCVCLFKGEITRDDAGKILDLKTPELMKCNSLDYPVSVSAIDKNGISYDLNGCFQYSFVGTGLCQVENISQKELRNVIYTLNYIPDSDGKNGKVNMVLMYK